MNICCIVPKCTGSNGVPLPRDVDIKSEWLKNLKLQNDVEVNAESFVCFSHFDPNDVKEVPCDAKKVLNRIKRGALPNNPEPLLPGPKDGEGSGGETLETDVKIPDDKSGDAVKEVEKKSDNNEKETQLENLSDDVCRACMSKNNVETNIYDHVDDSNVTIGSVFMLCAYPINVFEDNNLSQKICNKCLDVLKIIHNFRRKCMTTNDILLGLKNAKRKLSCENDEQNYAKKKKFNHKDKAVKIVANGELYDAEGSTLDVTSSDFEIVYEDSEKNRVDFILSGDSDESDDDDDDDDYEEIEQELRQNTTAAGNFDDIERNMEEIHGQNTKVLESSTTMALSNEATLEEVINTLEENTDITIKKCPAIKRSAARSNIHISSKKESSNSESEIRLPRGVKIRPIEKFQSDWGEFPVSYRSTINDVVFLEADGYLFEFGLLKANIRHLKCTVPSCPSHAQQKSLGDSKFEDKVDIIIPHNHQKPDEPLKTKQMFLCIMRKKMQTDRNLNIRGIYEAACKQDSTIREIVPLRNVINEICRHQLTFKMKTITTFEDFYAAVEHDCFEKLHFTHNNQQFYQEKFFVEEEGSMAVVFGNIDIIQQVSSSHIMYVDASFKIDTNEDFKYQLITVLVWIEDSYYPILYTLVNRKTQLIFREIFSYLHDHLAPELRPLEIITDYEANLYYALAETYTDCNIGGSVFYYTQNLYKKICSLNLSRDLETNQYFRNIYHMLLMLPLLPVNTIMDGLNSIEVEAKNLNISELARPLFDHIRVAWMLNVTPELFCVHKLENRINENVIAPFKKLRDFLLLSKGKLQKTQVTIMHVIEKLIELEDFLRTTYSKPDKKTFGRDLSSYQKKNVLRAWQYIEDHPKIEINSFFAKVLGYIKCMENQLWIWGFYRYDGDTDDILINAAHFSIVNPDDEHVEEAPKEVNYLEYVEAPDQDINTVVMEAVVDQDGVLQTGDEIIDTESVAPANSQHFESAFLKYVYQ